MLSAYAKYLGDLMQLWQGWSQSIHMRKYLYMSLGLVIGLGIAISFIPYMHYVGVPVAFLLISGFDFLKRRRQIARWNAYDSHYAVQMEDHPEDYDDLPDELERPSLDELVGEDDWPEDREVLDAERDEDDRLGSINHMQEDNSDRE